MMAGQAKIEGVVVIPSAATGNVDGSKGNYHTFTAPAGNVTLTLSNVKPGQVLRLAFTQDGVGGRTITWAGQTLNAFTAANKTTPAAGAGAVTIFEICGSAVDSSTADVVNKFAQ